MARMDSTRFAIDEARALAQPLPEPPQPLDDAARAFWGDIIESKRRTAWTTGDLIQACQLARDYAAIEALHAEIEREGQVLTGPNGRKYANPATHLLDKVQRRAIFVSKNLQIHAVATSGKGEDQPKKNEAVREIAAKLANSPALIAKPQ